MNDNSVIMIPVYGSIRAGIPVDGQNDVVDHIEVPKENIKNDKQYFALMVSGDSMLPKYEDGDIVIYELCQDVYKCNNKDAAVLIGKHNGTFKKVKIHDDGIELIPYNTEKYETMFFSSEEVSRLPVEVIGIAVEKRTMM